MARKKPDNIEHIADNQHADRVLAEVGALQRQLRGIESDLNDEIDQAKAAAAAKAAPIKERMAELDAGLLAYAEYNKDRLFRKRRSVKLHFGTLGFRRSTQLKTATKWTWAAVLDRLKELGLTQAVRVKESVDKEALATLPDAQLEQVGVVRRPTDSFWYEVDEHAIEESAA
ncbi:MAG TPA: host-nuclease inhibitor Gam family protein [Gammaproteobacteria bacterium]|nr:host-nuclease inhibitor Gam family protein [Gammaproteobacteria bacterium]